LKSSTKPDKTQQTFSGIRAETLTYQGRPVGGVEVLRLRQTLPANTSDEFIQTVLGEWGQGVPKPNKIAGVRVWEIDGARGGNIGGVAWLQGRDAIITFAKGLDGARTIATGYIKTS